ncbi:MULTISPECIES: terminase large subunit [unclassified Xanthobacter]|uniref:terminase large subunit n=1 Tax=unclassified Xanthobacter TaxID=2623496 RepID=UPI001F23C41F|nr:MULTISPECIES: terminase TerL endonuclease subunit [unclassified Xanthobacter]
MMIPSWIDDGSEIPDSLGCGERAVQWLRKLKHPKSRAPGHPFTLDPWQERIIRRLYGPRHADGSRVARRLVLVVPRGNRKTSLCAAITLLHLMGPERQPGGLIVSAASAHDQALELYREVDLIVAGDRRMAKHLRALPYKSEISFPDQRVTYRAVASDGKTQHGKTPNVVIADELHVWEGTAGRKQWEALTSALVKVPETLLIVATTSGRGQENLAWKTVDYAMKVQKGEIDDPATLPAIFMLEEGDDWQSEAVWARLNPGMVHGYPDLEGFRDEARKAILSPHARDQFLQFNLNRWLDQSASPFLDMGLYDACAGTVDLDALADQPCWIGVDMSVTTDLTAVVACWRDGEGGYIVHPWLFCPEEALRTRAERDGVPYPLWAEQGFLTPTPGQVVDYRAIEDCIRDLCARFPVREIGFDRAYAQPVMSPLLDDGLPVQTMQLGWVTQSPALSEIERAVLQGRFRHGGHPVLRWCFDNVAIHTDQAGNRTMHKGKSTGRIDGAFAAWMAVSLAAAGDGGSIYDSEEWTPDLMVLA